MYDQNMEAGCFHPSAKNRVENSLILIGSHKAKWSHLSQMLIIYGDAHLCCRQRWLPHGSIQTIGRWDMVCKI